DYDRLRVIAGFSADKDIERIAQVINAMADELVLTKSRHPRAAEPADIAHFFPGARLTSAVSESLCNLPEPGSRELVLITGSEFPVAEARVVFGLVPPEDIDDV
ncbi:MAG TPA: hypothetical protein VFS62_13175, partial [Chloroflexota bacterium]|nr:hypothetical protein [Chloroflexota bacterium]